MKHPHNPASEGSTDFNRLTADEQISILKKTFNTPGAVSPAEDIIDTLEQQAGALQQQAKALRQQARALQQQELREVVQDRNGLWLKADDLHRVVEVLVKASDILLALARANFALAVEEVNE